MNKPEPATKPLALGKAVHKAIELKLQGVPQNDAVVAALAEADFHPKITRTEIVSLMHNAPPVKGQTEVHFVLPLAANSELVLQGYIDLVGAGSFLDWKTNWRIYGANDTMQLKLYAWAMCRLQERDTIRGTLYFLRYKKPVSHTYNTEDTEKARQWAFKLANEISLKVSCVQLFPEMATNQFPAQPGSYCKHCAIAVECYTQNQTTLKRRVFP